MSVELIPAELGFRRPFTEEVAETLSLINPNKDPVVFKVKTTAPKQYCVRPNSGRIEAGEKVEVQVLLQAMKEDPPLDAKCRDKFLVQSVAIPADQEVSNVASVWSSLESKAKGSVEEKKIRVSFLPPRGSTPHHAPSASIVSDTPSRGAASPGTHHEEPPAYSSPLPTSGTPMTQPEDDVPSPPTGEAKHSEVKEEPSDTNDTAGETTTTTTSSNARNSVAAAAGAASSTIAAAASTVANAVPTSTDELKAQLADAQATISQLNKQIQEQGLRLRKAPASGSEERKGAAAQAQMAVQQAPSGVAVPIVAAMCLLSFLLAYLFF